MPTQRLLLPPSLPALNPVARVCAELRRRVEGQVSASADAKQASVEAYRQELAADPARVRRRCGWDWIVAAFAALPTGTHPVPAATV